MGVEGGVKCVKFLLFFFNFIFWLCGLTFIVLGVLAQLAVHETLSIKDVSASGIPIVFMAVGVVIFLIAFFGCCGAFKENYCMVAMFAILVFLVILVEIAAIITGYIFRNTVRHAIQESLTEMIDNYNEGAEEFRDFVDKQQQKFKCCGVNNSSDWENFASDRMSVPDSCCVTVTENCGVGAMMDAAKVYQKGCHDASEAFLKKNYLWLMIAAKVISVLQILGIVFACKLMTGIRSSQRDSVEKGGEGECSEGPQAGTVEFSQGPQAGTGEFSQGPQAYPGEFSQGPQAYPGEFSQGPQARTGEFSQGPQAYPGEFSQGPRVGFGPGPAAGRAQPMYMGYPH